MMKRGKTGVKLKTSLNPRTILTATERPIRSQSCRTRPNPSKESESCGCTNSGDNYFDMLQTSSAEVTLYNGKARGKKDKYLELDGKYHNNPHDAFLFHLQRSVRTRSKSSSTFLSPSERPPPHRHQRSYQSSPRSSSTQQQHYCVQHHEHGATLFHSVAERGHIHPACNILRTTCPRDILIPDITVLQRKDAGFKQAAGETIFASTTRSVCGIIASANSTFPSMSGHPASSSRRYVSLRQCGYPCPLPTGHTLQLGNKMPCLHPLISWLDPFDSRLCQSCLHDTRDRWTHVCVCT